jgi:F-type H+-transporting ATPase subunit gamma
MTERLSEVVKQIENVRQLNAVVTAIRGIAASRARHGRSLLAGIEEYTQIISTAIGQALTLPPSEESESTYRRATQAGLILFCAEQGFAGAFSERVFDAVANEIGGVISFIIGTRGLTIASEREIRSAWTAAMATDVRAIAGLANRLSDALYDRVAEGSLGRVDVVFARMRRGGGIEINRRSLLPIDLHRFQQPVQKQPPLSSLAPRPLLERLAAEYVHAQLCEAAMHAFAAENEARMIAMSGAKANIETKLARLSLREHQLRQEAITTEIIELTTGTLSLN